MATPKVMQAARIVAPGRVELGEVPVPEPGEGEVRIRIEGCGVCASNLGPWQGLPWLQYPMAPGDAGHEGWGRIDAVGRGVTGLAPGDRVAAISYRAYAEYDTAAADSVIRLPNDLADTPFPGEPIGCAFNVFERSRIEAGQTIAVVGVGFLGAIVIRLAQRAGARVIGISRRPYALEVAKQMGADEVIALTDPWQVMERVNELTDGMLCDRAIEAAGVQQTLELSAELTRQRGLLIIAGYHQDGPRQVNMQLWNWRGFDVVNAHEREPSKYAAGVQRAVQAVQEGVVRPETLLTHRYGLDELDEALDATASRPDGFLKAWVAP